jgi:hypothetical protein
MSNIFKSFDGHNIKQVQSRDLIKSKAIAEFGYRLYVIKDDGKSNTKFVEKEFERNLCVG